MPGAEGTITREGTTTEYRVSIPWTSIGFDEAPELFSASILVADADGTHAREGYITWADGIASSKTSTLFRPMSMIGVPAPSCTETLTGTIVDRIAVTEGTLCVSEAELRGGITVSDQASLIVTNSTVAGRVSVDGGDQVRLIGSTFDGPVAVNGSTGHFVISGSTFTGRLSCTGNTNEPVDDGAPNTVRTATGQCAVLR